MKSIGSLLVATTLTCCLLNTASLAQRLPTAKNQVLSSADKALIKNYISKWAPQLVAEDDRQVTAAKDQLIIPLDTDSTAFFLVEYRAALRDPLRQAFESKSASKRLIVRLNAMIVAAELHDTDNINLLIQGLNDQNPAVRYWAAQAIAGLTRGPNLKIQQRNKLFSALAVAVENEKIEPVLKQMMRALVRLTKHVPNAINTLLQTINKRVELHMASPQLGISAEIEGLRDLRQPLIESRAANPAATTEALRQFILVATRYHMLAATQLEQGKVPAIHRGDYITLLNLVDNVLPWAVRQLGVKTISPDLKQPIGPYLEQKQWALINLRAVGWQQLLIATLEFQGKEVTLKPIENKDD